MWDRKQKIRIFTKKKKTKNKNPYLLSQCYFFFFSDQNRIKIKKEPKNSNCISQEIENLTLGLILVIPEKN